MNPQGKNTTFVPMDAGGAAGAETLVFSGVDPDTARGREFAQVALYLQPFNQAGRQPQPWPEDVAGVPQVFEARLWSSSFGNSGGPSRACAWDSGLGQTTIVVPRNATITASMKPGVFAPGQVYTDVRFTDTPRSTEGAYRETVEGAVNPGPGDETRITRVPPQGSVETWVGSLTDLTIELAPRGAVVGTGPVVFAVGPATNGGRPIQIGPLPSSEIIRVRTPAGVATNVEFRYRVRLPG